MFMRANAIGEGGIRLRQMEAGPHEGRHGRFMQPDPIGYEAGTNLYAYVGGDPVNSVDTLGLGPHDFNCAGGGCADTVITGGSSSLHGTLLGGGSPAKFFLDAPLETAPGGEGLNGNQPSAPFNSQPRCLARPPAIPPSAKTTSRAVNQALKEAYGRGSGPTSTPLTNEFARLGAIPDFSRGGWLQRTSVHAGYAWELPIPNAPGYVVKVYINDRDLGGRNTVAITSPTYSLEHLKEYGVNVLTGYVGNAERAVEYLRSQQPCR